LLSWILELERADGVLTLSWMAGNGPTFWRTGQAKYPLGSGPGFPEGRRGTELRRDGKPK